MRTKTSFRLVLLVALLVACGCKGGNDFVGPTTPAPSQAVTPTPAPAGVNLTGAWSGTIRIQAAKFSGQIGCQALPIAGTVSQTGSRVSGQFRSSCAGSVRLDASLRGNQLDGSLASDILSSGASFSGQASTDGIHIVSTPANEKASIVILDLAR
jgi:hypothetical protein